MTEVGFQNSARDGFAQANREFCRVVERLRILDRLRSSVNWPFRPFLVVQNMTPENLSDRFTAFGVIYETSPNDVWANAHSSDLMKATLLKLPPFTERGELIRYASSEDILDAGWVPYEPSSI